MFSNTLGTALGDFLADDSGLGFGGSALLISALLAVIVLLYFFTKMSRIVLFWIAFVLTRPFGATFGDLLTKPKDHGGLDYGTEGASLILFGILIFIFPRLLNYLVATYLVLSGLIGLGVLNLR